MDPLAASFATTYAGVVAFIAVVAEGSFARAADRLGIGRSAVSRNVQKLEDQLHVRLLRRTTRSTALTREGDVFYASCHAGVDRIVQAVEEMRDLRNGPPRGHLRISAPHGFGRTVVAPLLPRFLASCPEVSVDLVLGEQAPDFTAGRVDVAFLDGRMQDADIIARQIIPMHLGVYAAPAYRDAHGLPGSVDDLASHRCVGQRLGNGRLLEWEFRVDGTARKFQPQARLTCNDPQLVLQAVIDGHGIAQLPGYLAADALRAGDLLPCLMAHAPDDRGHFLCYLSRQHMPTRMRAFIDFMIAGIRASDLQCEAELGLGLHESARPPDSLPAAHAAAS
jgi:DNA-binding transcriptional LysR family regulator